MKKVWLFSMCLILSSMQLEAGKKNKTGSQQKNSSEERKLVTELTSPDGGVVRLLRPVGHSQTCYVEAYHHLWDLQHPNGIEWVQFDKEGAAKPEAARITIEGSQRHESGYFIAGSRMKSPSMRSLKVRMKPIGADPIEMGVIQILAQDKIPDFLGFCNISNGETIESSKKKYIYVDATDSSCGIRGDGHPPKSAGPGLAHIGYRDDDGIKWVELVIDGPNGQEVLRSDAAFMFPGAQERRAPWWAEAVDPNLTKSPDERWPKDTELKPIEGFGFNEFVHTFKPGQYTLTLRAENNKGEAIEGPSIFITAK